MNRGPTYRPAEIERKDAGEKAKSCHDEQASTTVARDVGRNAEQPRAHQSTHVADAIDHRDRDGRHRGGGRGGGSLLRACGSDGAGDCACDVWGVCSVLCGVAAEWKSDGFDLVH